MIQFHCCLRNCRGRTRQEGARGIFPLEQKFLSSLVATTRHSTMSDLSSGAASPNDGDSDDDDQILDGMWRTHALPHAEYELIISTVLDLPQLYTRPTPTTLLATLESLSLEPAVWDTDSTAGHTAKLHVSNPTALASYLTTIIASPLAWIPDDTLKDLIYDAASARLSERSGRTAMRAMTRAFTITLQSTTLPPETLTLRIHEPSLTADDLGHKTWAASGLLAEHLHALLEDGTLGPLASSMGGKVLELGAGTGLLGLAAAAVLKAGDVLLTDLPAILPNLRRNVLANLPLPDCPTQPQTCILDWAVPSLSPRMPDHSFTLILAADPIYAPEMPALFVRAVACHLSWAEGARVVVAIPLREGEGFRGEREGFRSEMGGVGLEVRGEGVWVGEESWGVVRVWWSVWGWMERNAHALVNHEPTV